MAEQEPNMGARDFVANADDATKRYFAKQLTDILTKSRLGTSSESVGKIGAALAKAQAAFETPKKTKVGKVSGKTAAGKWYEYSYNYADLQDVYECVRKPLAENDLAITHLTQEFAGQLELVTMLIHGESGEWLKAIYPVSAPMDKPQKVGSAMTYAKRYTISALLGIASEEDDDGAAAEGAARAAGSDPAHEAVHQRVGQKARQKAPQPAGDPMIIMSPATGENEEEFPRTQGGARDFLEALEIRCNSDTSYWKLHRQEAVMVAEKLPDLNVNGESASRMVDRMDGEYGGTIDPDDVDAGKQGPKQAGKIL